MAEEVRGLVVWGGRGAVSSEAGEGGGMWTLREQRPQVPSGESWRSSGWQLSVLATKDEIRALAIRRH